MRLAAGPSEGLLVHRTGKRPLEPLFGPGL
jgi:hypothetical protein